ncbi:MAG: PIN domain-containing protein [Acidobacteriota bacterium]
MRASFFLDTNVLIYAVESGGPEPEKSDIAADLIRRPGVTLSVQVLGEFYRAVTSPRRASPLSHDQAVAWIQLWKRHDVRPLGVPHVDLALALSGRFKINYFDALILAAAHLSGCAIVYSEDLNAGQDYDGLRVENPFATT